MRRRHLLQTVAAFPAVSSLEAFTNEPSKGELRNRDAEEILWIPEDMSLEIENIHLLKEGFNGELIGEQDDTPEGLDLAFSVWSINEPFPLEIVHMVETADKHSQIDDSLEEDFGDFLEIPSSDPISIRERDEGPGEACCIGIERHGTVLSMVEVWVDIEDKHKLDTSVVDVDKGVTKPWI